MDATTTTKVHIRWAIRRDLPAITRILPGWGERRMLKHLRQRDTIGLVAETPEGEVVGFAFYRLASRQSCDCKPQCGWVRLLAVGVRPEHRRQGVGAALVGKVLGKVGVHRRPALVATVPESNLPAQLLLRAAGLLCEGVIPERFKGEDGFRFVARAGRDF